MNVTIRRVGIAMIALFVVLAGQLTYLQVSSRARELADAPENSRRFRRELRRDRGPIVSADGAQLALTLPSADEFERQRVYPPETAQLFAHVVGYQSPNFGSVGVERTYGGELSGRDLPLRPADLANVLSGQQNVGTVYLTMSKKVQETAAAALANRRGTVTAVDVRTGAIVALYSNPTFDPNLFANHDPNVQLAANQLMDVEPVDRRLARGWRERYPPGSTFKVATTAISLANNIAPPDRIFPPVREIPLPQSTNTLQNFGGARCGGTLEESFVKSCNTTFGTLGLELGPRFATAMPDFGLNTDPPPADLDPRVVPSTGPKPEQFKDNMPLFAFGAIGQDPVRVTPLELALVAESVATGGVIRVPHVLDRIEDSDGAVVKRYEPKEWRRAMTPEIAETLRGFMIQVVERGTGTAAQLPGVQVAGKTGTAQVEGQDPHAWFIAFAPANDPQYAVSVIVENGGDLGSEATGGKVAAPIAAQVLRALLLPAG